MTIGYFKSSFIRNVIILMTGTVGAHVITVLCIPITTRLYSPSEFSVLAIYTSILSVLLTFCTLNVHMAIPVATTRDRALGLLVVSGIMLFLMSILLTVVMLVGKNIIAALVRRPDFEPYLLLLVPGFVLGGAYASLQLWFSREKQFSLVAGTRVVRSVGGSGAQVALGLAGSGPIGLIIGHIFYNGLGSIGLLRRIVRSDGAGLRKLRRSDLLEGFRESRRYVLFSTPGSIANVAAIQLPVVAIAAYPTAGEVGHLYLAQMILMLPMMLVGSSVGQIFFTDASRHLHDGTLLPFTLKVMRGLSLTGVPALVLVGLVAPVTAGPILGPEWEKTGVLIVWLTPWMMFQFLSTPLSTIFYVVDRQVLAMSIQFTGLGLRLGSVLLSLAFRPELSMYVYAISGAVFYLFVTVMIVLVARKFR